MTILREFTYKNFHPDYLNKLLKSLRDCIPVDFFNLVLKPFEIQIFKKMLQKVKKHCIKESKNRNKQAKNEQTSKQSEENSWMKSTSFSVQKSGKRRSLNEDSDNDWDDSYVKRKYFSKE